MYNEEIIKGYNELKNENISKADKMFIELGYKKMDTMVYDIKYYKNDDNVFYFNIKQKTFNKSGEYDGMCNDITIQELQAINEKVKELGWNE